MIAMTPMIASVSAAFVACGRRNAGTPFEIASTPVSAVEPDEKAWSTAKTPIAVATLARSRWAPRGRGGTPTEALIHAERDHRQDRRHEPVGGDREQRPGLAYAAEVGERDQPDERDGQQHLWSSATGNADLIAKTPATTETTTVIT